jgi:ribosomal protein L31
MKKDIHPKYGELVISLPNGEKFTTRSTKQGEYLMDVYFLDCPAWNKSKVVSVNDAAANVAKFKDRYKGLGNLFSNTGSSE